MTAASNSPKIPPTSLPEDAAPLITERRAKLRFAVNIPVRYRTLGRKSITGEGTVVNMSSSGVLVLRPHRLNVNARLELRIEWPSMLNGQIELQLVAIGKVVRCDPSGFAAAFHRHQFRTVGRKKNSVLPQQKLAAD